MKRIGKDKNILKEFRRSVSTVCEMIGHSVFEELDKISVLIQICYPLLFFVVPFNAWEVICFSIFVTFITGVLRRFHMNLVNYSIEGIPLPPRRLTKRDVYGFVEFNGDGDVQDALVYLDRIETYLEKKGMIDYGTE